MQWCKVWRHGAVTAENTRSRLERSTNMILVNGDWGGRAIALSCRELSCPLSFWEESLILSYPVGAGPIGCPRRILLGIVKRTHCGTRYSGFKSWI